MAKTEIIIEFGGPNAEQPFFPPLQKQFRGRIQLWNTKGNEQIRNHELATDVVPGERLHFDTVAATAWIEEPLYHKEHEKAFNYVARRGLQLLDQRQPIAGTIDVTSYLWYARRLVDAGLATVVSGDLPVLDKIDKSKVKFDYVVPRQPTQIDKLADSFKELAAAIRGMALAG